MSPESYDRADEPRPDARRRPLERALPARDVDEQIFRRLLGWEPLADGRMRRPDGAVVPLPRVSVDDRQADAVARLFHEPFWRWHLYEREDLPGAPRHLALLNDVWSLPPRQYVGEGHARAAAIAQAILHALDERVRGTERAD
ncbi:hypothetical protein [Roseisolibacter sp. H3M3-2]|uniref:hypothetical protein n=1 Tax=Roseisolibacter sp. H3M3-2 TaxID=3031323 RepID=UPI0023D9EF44|nr:hypothetical protein [Roseisolibacter sp. H3M3-2]MDF1501630.1 hypothetical protein [Roseisolibacter sp. H3M3-2]